MSALNAVCTNGSLREFWSAPFVEIEVDLSEHPDPPEYAIVRFTGPQASLVLNLAVTHVWWLSCAVIPSFFS